MNAPRPKTKYVVKQQNFLGIDLRNSPANVDRRRSPMCINMIRDNVGTNKKRFGYETIVNLGGRINGFHFLKTPKIVKTVVHSGTNLYEIEESETKLIYSKANNEFSTSAQMNSKLYILDGKDLLVYDGETVKSISEEAYIPTITIAKTSKGGGTSLEPVNLLTPKRIERFCGDAESLTYQLGASEIDEEKVKISQLTGDGIFKELTEGIEFTVNRVLGTVTLKEPVKTPIDGADNLYITYAKTIAGYADRIKNCNINILYGMNGLRDRLFISGNKNYPHYDWYCKSNDPSYWGDIWYSTLGQDNSEIIGYSILNGALLTYKNGDANDSNVIIRNGVYDNESKEVRFRVEGNYEAEGALSKYTLRTIKNEPLYLTTNKTIHAITPSDLLGERSSQERSYYISSALEVEPEELLKNAYACTFKEFYMLAVGERVYILDTAQYSFERNAPFSKRQYECYLWTHINARIMAEINDQLYFGTEDGKVKRFFDENVGGYTDDGEITKRKVIIDGEAKETEESFPCYWETAEIYTGSGVDHSELKKTFKHIAMALNAYAHTGCRIWARIDGIWEPIFDYDASASFIDFNDIDFSDFSFRTDTTPTLVGGKFKGKKLLHIQFRFENSKPQPFSVLWAKIKYVIGNEYRK